MDHISKYLTKEIKLSCYEDKLFKSDLMFDDHMLVWFISGETKIIQADKTYYFHAGDTFLIPRNQLATVVNYPKDGLPHKTVVLHLSVERLKHYYEKIDLPKPIRPEQCIYSFNNHPLLKSYLNSLLPYFEMEETFPEHIASLKITEAIAILRSVNPDVDKVLAHFDAPGKIDLINFMERNFMFNMPLEKLGYLTGRSLSTFNRDFKRHFNNTPQKWLIAKRLELAYYQLSEKNRKPKDVFLEVGFEDLSHFSFAFKKKYGISPTQLKPGLP
ncbi:helix-turn-helix domain-containing protein [Chryseobacterium sp. YR221]|uniref:helix-turn-helix domain-containing protein n=1 Tax=Chryseobacterium sp. YR221 TaxID=1500293 RepID=UPI000647FE95|nr:AraC family transcriptional regulator [Chryseobacterium sp. YR221]SMC96570.1 AraC-type DNA-binding protein [Chryseobacterium sp. YR221]